MNLKYVITKLAQETYRPIGTSGNALNIFSNKSVNNDSIYGDTNLNESKFNKKQAITPISGAKSTTTAISNGADSVKPTIPPLMQPDSLNAFGNKSTKTTIDPPKRVGLVGVGGNINIK